MLNVDNTARSLVDIRRPFGLTHLVHDGVISQPKKKERTMTITEEIQNNVATLNLEGSFTYTQRKLFQDTLKNLATQNVEHVIVDRRKCLSWIARHWGCS